MRPSVVDWRRVDWTKRDIDIAREVGRTKERVRQMRRELRKPNSPYHRWPDRAFEIEEVAAHLNGTAVNSRDLEAIGLSRESALRHGIKVVLIPVMERKSSKHPWHLMNWDLPNADLEEIWRVPTQRPSSGAGAHSDVAQRRSEKKHPRRWNRAGGRRPNEAAYWRALDAEQIKARKWLAERNGSNR